PATGFDEVEIPDALAARQPEPLWARRRASYQARVRA
ncbi:oxidoreductase, partial [Amaricoccus sp. HAR-UPW-R2A-40]